MNDEEFIQGLLQVSVTKARNSPKETQILKEDKVTGFASKYLRTI